MLDEVTEVTLPPANPNPVRPPWADPEGAPGTLPPLGRLPPFGGAPPGNPPPAPRPPAPNRPVVQLPEVVGLLTVTLLATKLPVAVDPVTVTQSPAATL